ncbi:MAG: hypothetical protein JWM43_3912 [Acidobacteriaceae bacterium]|nr:hypothetical protein [Acidobacteriaceae bacterium]
MGQIEERLEAVAKLIQSDRDAAALRLHVEKIIDSPAFSSSRRSGQFLQYIVEKALSQEIDALKERTIGIEVFHRPPDYDTGEDAVVRVTASDVRRRLVQHYSKEGRASEFKISLPPGGYAPEISRDSPIQQPVVQEHLVLVSPEPGAHPPERFPINKGSAPRASKVPWPLVAAIAILVMLLLGAWAILFEKSRSGRPADSQLWSLLFSSGRPLYVVLSDPDLNEIQILTGQSVSVSDYANGKLGCETLAPPLQKVCSSTLRGDKVAAVDASALGKIASVASLFGSAIEPHPAREIRLSDLKTDRNMLFLGSRRANPWTDLFRDKLDFYVAHDDITGLQVVHNTHPKPGEAEFYTPTAGPQGTGENYTVISFVPGLNGVGFAMLLTGATHEGTDAAVAVVTDQDRLKKIIGDCQRKSESAPFQILLKLKMMVGSPLTTEVIACHVL